MSQDIRSRTPDRPAHAAQAQVRNATKNCPTTLARQSSRSRKVCDQQHPQPTKMATTTSPPKIGGFPGPLGTKRRRMRSGGNVSTMSNNSPKSAGMDEDDPKPPSAKCKATSIPIFLKSKWYGSWIFLALERQVASRVYGSASWPGEKSSFTATHLLTFIFLVSLAETYKMIDTCDGSIASW